MAALLWFWVRAAPCGSGDASAGVYRFDRPGVGAIMIPVPKPNGVRMWGTA
jgi:hypothetical protein